MAVGYVVFDMTVVTGRGLGDVKNKAGWNVSEFPFCAYFFLCYLDCLVMA